MSLISNRLNVRVKGHEAGLHVYSVFYFVSKLLQTIQCSIINKHNYVYKVASVAGLAAPVVVYVVSRTEEFH